MSADSDAEVETSLEISEYETQFVPLENDEETLWEVIEILQEKGNRYRVMWAGNDPATGKPWAPSWVAKHDCTDKLIHEWKVKQAKKKMKERKSEGKGRISAASSKPSKGSRRSTITPVSTTSRQTRRSSVTSGAGPSTRTARASTSNASHGDPSGKRTSNMEPPPLPSNKRKRASSAQYSGELEDDDSIERPEVRPKKKRKVVEVVVSPPLKLKSTNKVGPPRGVKRDQQVERRRKKPPASESTEQSAPPEPPIKVGPPQLAKQKGRSKKNVTTSGSTAPPRDAGPSKPSDYLAVAVEDTCGNSLQLHDNPTDDHGDLWEIDLEASYDDHVASRDVIIPETQSLHIPENDILSPGIGGQSLDAVSPDPAARGHVTCPVPSRSSTGSIVSRMKPRTPGKTPAKRTGSASGPLAQQEENEAEDERAQAKKPSKPLRRIPVISPSTFRPHLPQPEPPPSSIEQFSSPEKGSAEAAAVVRRKVQQRMKGKGKDKATPSRRDDETLRIRGQKLAEDAAASRRTEMPHDDEDQSHLFELESTPEPPNVEEQFHLEIYAADTSSHPTQGLEPVPEEDEDEHNMFDAYVDLNGGVEHETFLEERSDIALSIGPDLPGNKRTSPFNLARRAKHQRRLKRTAHETVAHVEDDVSLNEALSVLEELPATTSTQQADRDSQSQHDLEAQINGLSVALGEKPGQITDLERQLLAIQSRVDRLEEENANLLLENQGLSELHMQVADLKSEKVALLRKRNDEASEAKQQMADLQTDNTTLSVKVEQLSELRTQIAQLRAENDILLVKMEELPELRLQVIELQAENATRTGKVSALQAHVDRIEADKAAFATKTEALQRAKGDAEEMRDLFQKQYGMASSYASEVDAKNKELEAELKVSKSQVSDGIAMVRALYIEQTRKLQEEVDKWKSRCNILTEKDERTNDEIHRRAALEPQLREEIARLNAELEETKSRYQDMEDSEVLRQLSHPIVDDDGVGDVSFGADPAENSMVIDEDFPDDGEKPEDSDVDDLVELGEIPEDFFPPAPASSRRSENFLHNVYIDYLDVFHVCQYTGNGAMCNARFGSDEEVRKHAFAVHYPYLLKYVDV